MIKSKEIRHPKSCLNQSQSDEPIFVLCARDEGAPAAVRSWARRYVERHDKAGTLTERRNLKAAEAFELARSMQVWRREHVTDEAAELPIG